VNFFVTVPANEVGKKPLVSDNTIVFVIDVEDLDPSQDALNRLKTFKINQYLYSELKSNAMIAKK
jgi:hypothetical protein